MIKLEKMSYKQLELDLIAEWRNQSMISLRSSDLTAKGEAQRKWVESFTDKEKYYFIYHDKNGEYENFHFAGYCGLDKINSVNRTAEIGLLIKPECRKYGLGAQAVKDLLKLAFTSFNLNCVFAEVIINGTNNTLFWKKQGFTEEGILKQRHFKNDIYFDSMMLSFLKQNWGKIND